MKSLLKHLRGHKLHKKQCMTCSISYVSGKEFEQHMCSSLKVKSFKCEQCDKAFSNKATLNIHTSESHNTDGAYKCKICGESFNRSAALKRHSQMHSLLTHTICKICGLQFKDNPEMVDHIRVEHPSVQQAEKGKCDWCGKMFEDLESHIENAHRKGDLTECPYCGEMCLHIGSHVMKKHSIPGITTK